MAAAVVGTAGGAVAGLWSVRHERSTATPVVQTPATTAAAGSSSIPSTKNVDAPTAAAAAALQPRSADEDVLPRARSLARRPDVKALVELRESFVWRAEERGERESVETKRQLHEVDRYLAEARSLRLKLDALELKNASADGSRPR